MTYLLGNAPRLGIGGAPSDLSILLRRSYHVDSMWEGKLYLRRMKVWEKKLKSDEMIFWVGDDAKRIDFMIRASDRETAKRQILKLYPLAKFMKNPLRRPEPKEPR